MARVIIPKLDSVIFKQDTLIAQHKNEIANLRISLTTDIRKVVDPNASNTVILKTWAGRMAKIKEWKPE